MAIEIKNLAKVIEEKKQTFDYVNYTYLKGVSRKIDDEHVKKIMDSMVMFGAEATSIVVIETCAFGKKLRINADGNHRSVSGKLLNLPLDIKVVKLTDDTIANVKKYIACLNNNLKKWNNQIYLEVFADGEIYEYVKFKKIMSETNLTITDLLNIYCGSGATKKFQLGELTFKDEKDSDKLLDEVIKLNQYLPKHSFTRRGVWSIMRKTKGDYSKMGNAIINYANNVKNEFSADEKTFKNQITNIFNETF